MGVWGARPPSGVANRAHPVGSCWHSELPDGRRVANTHAYVLREGAEDSRRGAWAPLFLRQRGDVKVMSRRDILRIARRFNAGKHSAWSTSPEGTTEGWRVGLDLPAAPLRSAAQAHLSRPFGTRGLLASNPALKRWAILACPFGTEKQPSSHAAYARRSRFVSMKIPGRACVACVENSCRSTTQCGPSGEER